MFVPLKLSCFGALLRKNMQMSVFFLIWMYFLLARIDLWNIYNRLVIEWIVKTAAGVWCLCSTLEKASLSSSFFVSWRLLALSHSCKIYYSLLFTPCRTYAINANIKTIWCAYFRFELLLAKKYCMFINTCKSIHCANIVKNFVYYRQVYRKKNWELSHFYLHAFPIS